MPSFQILADQAGVFSGEKASLSQTGQLMLRGSFAGRQRIVVMQVHPGTFLRLDGSVAFTCHPARVADLEREVRAAATTQKAALDARRAARSEATPAVLPDRVRWGADATTRLAGEPMSIFFLQGELKRRGIRWQTDYTRLNAFSAEVDPQVQREIAQMHQRHAQQVSRTPVPPPLPAYLRDEEPEPTSSEQTGLRP